MSGDATLKHVLEKFPELLRQFIWLALSGALAIGLSFRLDEGIVRATLQIAGAIVGGASFIATLIIMTERAVKAIAGLVSRRKLRAAEVAALQSTTPALPAEVAAPEVLATPATPELPAATQVVRAKSEWEQDHDRVERYWEDAHPAQRKIVMQIYEAGEGLFPVGSTEDAVAMTLIDDGFLLKNFAILQPDGAEANLYRLSEIMYWILDYKRMWDSTMKYHAVRAAEQRPAPPAPPPSEPPPPDPAASPSSRQTRPAPASAKVIQPRERSVKRR